LAGEPGDRARATVQRVAADERSDGESMRMPASANESGAGVLLAAQPAR
jgi:hypothetical protein